MTASEFGLYVDGLSNVLEDEWVSQVNIDHHDDSGLVGMVVFSIGHADPPVQALACTFQVNDAGILGVQVHAFDRGHRVVPATSIEGLTALVETGKGAL